MIRKYGKLIGLGVIILIIVFILNINTNQQTQTLPDTPDNTSTDNIQARQTREDVINPTTEELKTLLRQQADSDAAFSDGALMLANEFPWFNKLPLETSQYKVVYDYELQQFRVRIKPGVSESVAVQNAVKALNEIGVQDPTYYVLF